MTFSTPQQRRINAGCGMTPTAGWINIDNSPGIKLARVPFLPTLLHRIKILTTEQMNYIRFCRKHNILWADVTRRIPQPDASVDALYSSHMLEHLDQQEALLFLREAKRVLTPGGVLRLALPDIKKLARNYLDTGDADAFIEACYMCIPRPRTLPARLKSLLVGTRHHQWMYDGKSLSALLAKAGFANPIIMPAGQTLIPDPGPLDIGERAAESVYVEANKI